MSAEVIAHPTITLLQTSSLVNVAHAELEQLILSGRLAPGKKLTELTIDIKLGARCHQITCRCKALSLPHAPGLLASTFDRFTAQPGTARRYPRKSRVLGIHCAAEAIKLRQWDEEAKQPGLTTLDFVHFLTRVARCRVPSLSMTQLN